MSTDVGLELVQPDAVRAIWLSMTNLVALSLCAKLFIGFDWGLEDIYFPMLRRLRVDSHSLCPSLITLHIHSLTHLRLDDNVDVPPNYTQPTSLTHYHGPLDARTLQVCAIYERDVYGRAEWPSLSPLAACHSFRTLMVDLEASEAELLHMLKDCPRFPSMDILFLAYNSVWSNHYPTQPHLQRRREPCFERLLALFPTTKRIAVFDDDWDAVNDDWIKKQVPAWAERVSKTCSNAEFITFGEEYSVTRAPDQSWTTIRHTWEFEETFGQWVVPAVPG